MIQGENYSSLRLLLLPLISLNCHHFITTNPSLRWALLPLSIPQPVLNLPFTSAKPGVTEQLRLKVHHFLSKIDGEPSFSSTASPMKWQLPAKLHLDPDELLLSTLYDRVERTSIEIRYPSTICPDNAKSDIMTMITSHNRRSTLLLSLYGSLLPLTLALTILPGPNIFLFGNCLRMASLWRARQASSVLKTRLRENSITFKPYRELPCLVHHNSEGLAPLIISPTVAAYELRERLGEAPETPLFSRLHDRYLRRLKKKLGYPA